MLCEFETPFDEQKFVEFHKILRTFCLIFSDLDPANSKGEFCFKMLYRPPNCVIAIPENWAAPYIIRNAALCFVCNFIKISQF